MSLTFQPFAEVPQVDDLGRDLRMNISNHERVLSALAGGSLLAAGAARRGGTRWLLLVGGAALLWRGWTGKCQWYHHLGVDRRHDSSGVAGNTGVKIEHSVQINRSARSLYEFWRDLENLPKVMRHVISVRQLSERRSHWEVKAPMGATVKWEAEIINDIPGKLIAWQTLPGASVRSAGSVWFEEGSDNSTRVKVSLEFDPPAGIAGAAVAALLGVSPKANLAEDLSRFKAFAERELVPFGAHTGT